MYINKFQFLQVPDKENLEEEFKKEEEERRRQEEEAEERKRIQVWPFFSFFFSMRFWNAILADDLRLLFSHIDEIKKNPPTDYAVTKGIINCEFGKTFTLPSTCREVLSRDIKAETISVSSIATAYKKRMIVRQNFDLLLFFQLNTYLLKG